MKLSFLQVFAVLIFASLLALPIQTADANRQLQCKPLGYTKAELLQLREQKFAIANDKKRHRFAIELLNCVGNPDPELRDKIAYEGFSAMLRGKQLEKETINTIRSRLIKMLGEKTYGVDPDFERPFAALILSEVARVDRVERTYSDEELTEILAASATYMQSITDYRGFDEKDGWRHGVAHTADVLMQLALNPRLDKTQLETIRDAVESQIFPRGHFFIYGEPRRLARPILFAASRSLISEEEWAAWFTKLADPAPLGNWGTAYQSQAGLARLHNLKAFANIVYIGATNSKDPEVRKLIEPAIALVGKLP